MKNEPEIFVVVADNDQPIEMRSKVFVDEDGPLIFEQYTRQADIDKIMARAKTLSKRFGRCRIARLEFLEPEEVIELLKGEKNG